ncbi:hypothetical protein Q5752_003977 [Cryptotrichosporon argae]
MDFTDGFGREPDNGFYGRQRGFSGSTADKPAPPLPHHPSSNSGTSAYSDRPASVQSDDPAGQQQRPGLVERRTSTSTAASASAPTGQSLGAGGQAAGAQGAAPQQGQAGDVVSVGFDEAILRGLCEIDGALPLVADRIKQSIASCKQVAVFFRSRADIEEKYARSLVELHRNTGDVYSRADCKAGSFVAAYHQSLRLQDQLAQNRIRFAQRLNEMSDELLGLAREGEKLRKTHKENGTRYQVILQESEMVMDKAKARFDSTAEELERVLVAKEGESFKDSGMRSSASGSSSTASTTSTVPGPNKRGIGKAAKGLFKGKNPAQMQRQEDDVRARMASASEAFRKAVLESQALRQEYFNFQLPKILRLLKECADELDMGTQYHLSRFAFLYESTLVTDGTILNPLGGPEEPPGLKAIFEGIDNRNDFKQYMQNYAVARGTPRGPRRDGPYDEGYLPPLPPHVQSQNGFAQVPASNVINLNTPAAPATEYVIPGIPANTGATFGVDLGEQLARDGTEVPRVVEKCAQAIEAFGLESMGIYRLSGTTSRVQALKAALDKDVEAVDVMSEQWSGDINVVSGALKLWFRELPEPLLTYGLYHGFIEAARYENDRLRHIRLHEQVNELPDPNYATLKFFMGHLDKVRRKESVNQMSVSNLSIVFGPTLLGAPPEEGGLNLEHMSFQCKAIETILEKYQEIFIEEEDDGGAAESAAA